MIASALLALLLVGADQVSDLNDKARAALDGKRPAEAVQLLEKALKLQPGEPVLTKNLAWAFFLRGQDAAASQRFVDALADWRKAVELNPDEPGYAAHAAQLLLRQYRLDEAEKMLRASLARHAEHADGWLLLGDTLALQDELPDALAAYEKAAALGEDKVAEVARASVERTRRQNEIEKDYQLDRTAYFDILGPVATGGPQFAGRLAAVLERARAQVCAELGVHPEHRVTVVLYPTDAFRQATGAHEWVGGLFDRKIRLPIADPDRDAAKIEAAFRHEFTHVIVSELAPNCPTFVNEGLAQVMENGRGHGLQQLATYLDSRPGGRDALPSLAELPTTFIQLTDPGAVTLAYLESHAFVDWLVGLNGTGPVISFIRALDSEPMDSAFQRCLRRPFAEQEEFFRGALRAVR